MPLAIQIAAALGFIGVALGAFGAHGLKNVLSPEALGWWHTAVLYQLIHAVAALFMATRNPTVTYLWTAGVLLFSGSLYIMALTNMKWLGAVTPFGGLFFLAGWAWIIIKPTARL